MTLAAFTRRIAAALVLGLLVPIVLADGGHEHGGHDQGGHDAHGAHEDHTADAPKDPSEYPATYFAHPDHVGLIYAHIVLMIAAWVFVLPVAVMLSIAKSRYTLLVQLAFLATNILGVVLSTIYNTSTPDLYPNNAHHKIGWIITWVAVAQILISAVGWVSGVVGRVKGGHGQEQAFLPVPRHSHDIRLQSYDHDNHYRFSDDSGQGTEPNTESSRSNSVSSCVSPQNPHKEFDNDDDDLESLALETPPKQSAMAQHAAKFVASRVWKYFLFAYKAVDRIILPFGFIALTTGLITFARFFEGSGIFSGLAHWIKGGVFLWLGLFTLGRWTGSFGELGWAWNVRPKRANQGWRPSAEFVESFLIFVYGGTNIFLEHLGGAGGPWTAQDLEHVSITVLFIGGGLCGMLIESTRIRDLLNTTIELHEDPARPRSDEEAERLDPPITYEFSLNPIPALVILLLGFMMSSHTQHSATSSMVHKQWGDLLTGASFARFLTYIIMYIRPPKSVLPSRPPTELLTSFGLIAGGIIFMASSADTVAGMIHYGLDAMVMYTVTMGLVGLLMAWEVIVLAIKGWAVRREKRHAS